MGVFDRAEKRIGAAVDKVFARAFKGDVQPVEIAARVEADLAAERVSAVEGASDILEAFAHTFRHPSHEPAGE